MRFVFCALVLLGLAFPAAAADLDIDVLRGSQPPPLTVGPGTFTRWSGFYAGGQIGDSDANANFSNATQSLVAFALRDTLLESEQSPSQWPVLGTANVSTFSYGGFAGYNTQWQDLILGVEANYNYAPLSLKAPSSQISRSTTDSSGNAYALTFNGTGSLYADNFATLRLRGGWVFGNFLPYGFFGFAMGVANNTTVSVNGTGTEYTSGVIGVCKVTAPCGSFPITGSVGLNSAILYGFTVGGGVDVALTPNIFLRAEFEFDQFNPPPGYYASVTTGRVGAGFKF